jgi:hypothetical protein
VATLWPGAVADEDQLTPKSAPDDESEFESEPSLPPAVEEIFEYGAEIDERRLVAALGGDEGERIQQAVQLRGGTDALAWYVNFHAKGAQGGIFIPLSSVAYLVARVFLPLSTDPMTKFRIAFRALHQHELFHFAVDYMAAQWEGLTGRPCHKPGRSLRDPMAGYIFLEEELANAHMLRSFRGGPLSLRVPGRLAPLRQFVKQQPPGYRDALRTTSRADFAEGCQALAESYAREIRGYDAAHLDAVDLLRLYPFAPTVDWRHCPIHVLNDGERLGLPSGLLELFRSIPELAETERFRRDLAGLPVAIQAAWGKTRRMLATTTTLPGLDFKPWERRGSERVYSVRLSSNYRAHLQYSGAEQRWLAVAVGTHKAMGHG